MNDQIRRILDHPATKPVAYVVSGFLVGLEVGYLLGRRNRGPSSPPPDELAKISKEVSELRAKRETKQPVLVEEIIVSSRTNMEEMIADPDIRTEGPDIIITRMADENWDYEEEKRNRDSLAPYVIHTDEFFSNEMDFVQHTWTYYEGDDVMIDEEDVVVYNHEQKLGELKFGHGSGDPNSVYIRNEKMKMEMEVLREEGLYSIEVMGLEVDRGEEKDVKHSNKRSKHDE
jgi:hypothetical protein